MFPTATVQGQGNNLHVSHGNDSGLFVRFYWSKVHEKHYVKINVPGDQRTEWDRPVTENDKLRFRQQWEAYNSQQNQFGEQTMLKDWDVVTEAQVAHLSARNIMTVEHLASMTDAMITATGMGTRDLVKKAQSYLADLVNQKQQEALHTELRKRDAKIAQQDEDMKKLQEQVASLAAAQAKPETLHVPKKGSS